MPRAIRMAQQGEQTRAAILDAAIELFGKAGFRSTSMSQIATRAGVVQSVLHHHFGSKDRLLLEALNRYYPASTERADMRAIAEGRVDFLDEMLRVTRLNADRPDLVRFFSAMSGEALTEGHPAQEFFVRRYEAVREGYVSAIAKSKGITRASDLKTINNLVTLLFAASDGLQMQWLRDPEIDYIGGIELTIGMIRQRMDAIADFDG
ncbi:TetR/AcrR family transcriptional regulator [Rhizobium hainanense]|uniref:Transcriptional regulator, TetR family n=1 Tax=Rhizobium hainanense TaxID=52131 RepID=A0A1C3W939_9HYPH|nr:TetR/AcrR family transcriptional regulator [Rhizobium hainanense]SCB36463.1 transcriptional regulator, TetR family [Rhizobium hainanense]